MLKSLCEYFLAPKLSDHQVNLQTELLHQYLSVRLSLITEDEPTPISPKHVFATHYDKVIRSVGCLAHIQTNSGECKNAQHKRRITLGNNSKNVLFSMAQNENHFNGLLQRNGWFNSDIFSVVKLSEEIKETSPFYPEMIESLRNGSLVAEKAVYKNTLYNCDGFSCVVIHEDLRKCSSVQFGIMKKIIMRTGKIGGNLISLFH